MPGPLDTLTLDMASLRNYVAGPVRVDGGQILADAFGRGIVGAVELVRFTCCLRVNARTRRSPAEVQAEFNRVPSQCARWYTTLESTVFAQWRVTTGVRTKGGGTAVVQPYRPPVPTYTEGTPAQWLGGSTSDDAGGTGGCRGTVHLGLHSPGAVRVVDRQLVLVTLGN